ncbi:DUF1653 domain-containing protein [Candidatus Gracilibacteria bacterium]|nr:DUF1653 domain-containing protein [Candidatus Gracilibacteria bacterium]
MTRLKPHTGEHYTHYKNPDKQYEIVCLAKDKETLSDLIVYRALYPVLDLGEEFAKDPVFVRTIEDFMAILPDGTERFKKV